MEEKTDALAFRQKLRAPIEGVKPPAQVKPGEKLSKRNILSSINIAYVFERLNDVFGEDGWKAEYEIIEADPARADVVVKCRFWAGAIFRESYGGNNNPDRGDAYKGACSDALGKCARQIGIGNDVYKGIQEGRREPQATNKPKVDAIRFLEAKAFLDAARAAGKTPHEIDAKLTSLGYKTAGEIKPGQLGAAMKWAVEKTIAAAESTSVDNARRFAATMKFAAEKPAIDRQSRVDKMFAIAAARSVPVDDVKRFAYESSHLDSVTKMNLKEIDYVIAWLEALPNG